MTCSAASRRGTVTSTDLDAGVGEIAASLDHSLTTFVTALAMNHLLRGSW